MMDVIPSGFPTEPLSRVLDGAIRGVAGVPSYLRKQAELRDFLGRVTEKYTTYCNEIYRNVRILAMPKPVELQQIYTQVRVADQIQSQQKKPEIEILRSILAGRDETDRNLSALAVAKSTPRLVLLGRPGSGKSTFLKYFLLKQFFEENLDRFPILIALNQLSHERDGIVKAVTNTFSHCGIEFAAPLTEKMLDTGRLHLLIDGLDELRRDNRNEVIGEIDSLTKQYRKCSFIIYNNVPVVGV